MNSAEGVNLSAETTALPAEPLAEGENLVEKPRTLGNVVEDFNTQVAQRIAGLTGKEGAEKTRLQELIEQRNEIRRVVKTPEWIKTDIAEIDKEIAASSEIKSEEELVIRAVGDRINALGRGRERFEEKLKRAEQLREEKIGIREGEIVDPEKHRRAQAADGAYKRLIEQEKERIEKESQEAQQFGEKLGVWQSYLENQAEIDQEIEEAERQVASLERQRESLTGPAKGACTQLINLNRETLKRLKAQIPDDVSFEGEPASEIEKMYREAVAEMKTIKEGKGGGVKRAEEPKKELSEEEKTAQAREHWQIVMGLMVTNGAFKESLTYREKEVLKGKLNRLEELSSFSEKIEKLRMAYSLPRKGE